MSEPPRPPVGYDAYGNQPGPWRQPAPTAQWQQPSGQWQQPSGQWQQPPAPRRRSKVVALVAGAVVLAVLATGGALYAFGAFSTEIRTEPVAYADADAFTTSVGQGVALPVAQAASTPPPATTAVSGGQVGLYGGTGDDKVCDQSQLVAFLEQDPAKAAAWAQAQGIQVSEIRGYVATLTPVLLRSDTAVTNHGFRNGVANPINSVLQAGTAVLVDDLGVPRARCLCGNPLAEGKQFTRSSYAGTQWAGFDQSRVAVVRPAPAPVTSFTLVNVYTGSTYTQPVTPTPVGTSTPTSGAPATSGARSTSSPSATARPGASRTQAPQGGGGQQPAPQPGQQGGSAGGNTRSPASSAAPAGGGGKSCPIPGGGSVKEGESFDVGGRNYIMGPGCKPSPV